MPADPAERDAIPVPEGITGEDKLELQNYLYHIGHADAELGRLVDAAGQAQPPDPGAVLRRPPAGADQHLPHARLRQRRGHAEPARHLAAGRSDAARAGRGTWNWPPGCCRASCWTRRASTNDPYFALTQWLAPQLAALTDAPGAPPPAEGADSSSIDKDMASGRQLRLDGKLDSCCRISDQLTAELLRQHRPRDGATARMRARRAARRDSAMALARARRPMRRARLVEPVRSAAGFHRRHRARIRAGEPAGTGPASASPCRRSHAKENPAEAGFPFPLVDASPRRWMLSGWT